jgi:ribosomal protein S18 acetylase RimI-like enzyme
MYLGTCAGKPVATSLLNFSGNVAGIYAVCTLPDFRDRGFGAAMTAFAVKDGFLRGCDLASLQSSPAGAPLYFKLGFRYVFDYQCWVVSPRVSGA